MDMRLDRFANPVLHVCQLLGKLVGGEEVNSRLIEPVGNDNRENLLVTGDSFKHLGKICEMNSVLAPNLLALLQRKTEGNVLESFGS